MDVDPAGSGGAGGGGSRCRRRREEDAAATKLQKVYRGYRTRRKLVDEHWRQLLDFVVLKHSTTSFYDDDTKRETETAASRWNRASLLASMVGKGLSRGGKAPMSAGSQHRIEAIDPRRRYGHNLRFYYDAWRQNQACQPFFYWLDVGEGKDLDLPECPRALLNKQCISYLGPPSPHDG